MPVPLFTTHSSPWQPETKNVQAVLGPCTVLASPKELQRWPAVQGGYGVNFKLECTNGWALPLSLYDQGRYVTIRHKVQRAQQSLELWFPQAPACYTSLSWRGRRYRNRRSSPSALQPIEDMLRKLGQALDSRRTATLMRRRTRRTWVRSAPRSLHRAQRTADKPKLYEKKVAAGAASPTSKGEAHERSHCRGADGAE